MSRKGSVPSHAEGYSQRRWWKEATVYQVRLASANIYPASFQDTNGDGHGDIKGITSRVDYLKDLGANVIWVSPIYKSPQVDMGYDISDYKDVDPKYGTLGDVDELIEKLSSVDMKLMMDLVVNHTSNEHTWFLESRKSVDNDKRGWYFWRKGKMTKDGKRMPPNNWCGILDTTQSAWHWDEHTQEYYLALFSAEQPDLNWDNDDVRAAVHDILRFWMDRGVAGFRMDVIDHISKVQSLPDAEKSIPGQYYQPGNASYANGPRLYEFLDEIRKVLDEYGDTITVGEMPFINDEDEIIQTVGIQGPLDMVFLFKLLNLDNEPGMSKWSYHEWDATDMKRIHGLTQRLMIDRNGWNAIFTENHDGPRSISRFADDSDEWRHHAAKMLCTKACTLGGTVYIYQGQELGMRNIPENWSIRNYKDLETQRYWQSAQKEYANNHRKIDYARKLIGLKARDHTRTPMQWDNSPNAGFCKPDTEPWMRVNDDYPHINVTRQHGDPESVLSYYQRCLKFRQDHKDVIIYGNFEIIDPDDKDIVSFQRFTDNERYVTVTNFTGKEREWSGLGDIQVKEWVLGNYPLDVHNCALGDDTVKLRPWEGMVGKCG
ncbi:alpha-glucosidase [Xylariaceae sp. FL1019]|nr:alpha-glucosidase [Xylariaceae sp. FL1019]